MEATIEEKLQTLSKLQLIDSKVDQISKLKGDLPQEVRDLEDEAAGLLTRVKKYQEDIVFIENEVTMKKGVIKSSNELIKKYKVQQNNVKNNREFEALTKEMEMQGLEIQAAERRINDYYTQIESKKGEISETKLKMDELLTNLNIKKSELDVIISEYDEEEKKLKNSSDKAARTVEDRLFNAYKKIRHNAKNGLAVVNVRRNACGGCFAIIPPQRQVEIRSKKEIIICENCGRILADVEVEEKV